jgi:signal transduction histidine kinase
MKIKYQLIATIVSFAIVLLIISLSIFYTNERVAKLSNTQDTTGTIQSIVGQLSRISDDYFLYQNDSQLLSWQSNIVAISGDLTKLSMKDPQQDKIMDTIRVDIQGVDSAFNNTVSYLQTAPRNQSVRILPEFQLVWSTLTDKTQTLSNDSAKLSQLLLIQTNQAQQSNTILIVILLAAFALYLLINYLINYRSTLKSISQLQTGLDIVGSGNLDYSLSTDKKNEIGELSNSFNRMAVNLKNITTQLQEHEHLAAIGQTARMVGHDIRNPLQAIAGDLYLIDNDVSYLPEDDTKKSLQESVRDIQGNLQYIAKIVEDLQDYAKPQKSNLERIEIEKVIEEIMLLVPVSPNHEVVIDIEKDLPKIVADFSMMKRALFNLVNNAVQAMPDSGRLTIQVQHKDAQIFITVEDTGAGISEEVKPRIFEPMFTTKSKGQGLGLAVVKRLLQAQGGTISFESQEGKGTKFTIKMSLAP